MAKINILEEQLQLASRTESKALKNEIIKLDREKNAIKNEVENVDNQIQRKRGRIESLNDKIFKTSVKTS